MHLESNKDNANGFCLELFSLSDIMETMGKRQVHHHDSEVERLDVTLRRQGQ